MFFLRGVLACFDPQWPILILGVAWFDFEPNADLIVYQPSPHDLWLLSVTESASRSRLHPAGRPMCEKCELIDRKIAQLRSFAGPDLDSLSRATMRAAVESMQAEKAALKCGIKN